MGKEVLFDYERAVDHAEFHYYYKRYNRKKPNGRRLKRLRNKLRLAKKELRIFREKN